MSSTSTSNNKHAEERDAAEIKKALATGAVNESESSSAACECSAVWTHTTTQFLCYASSTNRVLLSGVHINDRCQQGRPDY